MASEMFWKLLRGLCHGARAVLLCTIVKIWNDTRKREMSLYSASSTDTRAMVAIVDQFPSRLKPVVL